MDLKIPELSLVLLIGASGSGKSTFARKHFKKHEIVSSDECRGIVSNDENNQSATKDAFDLLHYIVGKRLKNGLLTVIDATNVQKEARRSLIQLAREYHTLPVAIALDISQEICETRNIERPDRNFGNYVIRQQKQQLKRSLRGLKREGFRKLHILKSVEEIDSITNIIREKLYNDKKDITGPFDIIGDIHGCYDEAVDLIQKLGYTISTVADNGRNFGIAVAHPENRKIIFLGDLVDRGYNSPTVLKLVMSMVRSGVAFCVPGNHEIKLQKKLNGKNVNLKHGLAETLEQLDKESPEFITEVKEFLYSLISHYVFDHGKLVVAHAGIKEEMQGRGSGVVRAFCLYGETTGEIDEFGLPVRYNWAAEYRGKAKVVYGHTPVPEAEWLNKTIDIDTGCVFGGKLTALRYPEEELVSVFLEHPTQAINYYKKRGINKVICEEKHMGSRAVLVICKDENVALTRFGISQGGRGICYTRTGRNFFNNSTIEKEFLDRIVTALTKSQFWSKHNTDWVCLDAELMPWSAKAQALIREQYAAVGASASNSLTEVELALQKATDRGIVGTKELLEKFSYKRTAVSKFIETYRNYCWEVNSVEDYKLAPFHILATEGTVHTDKNNQWHMDNIKEICQQDEKILQVTGYKIVDTQDESSIQEAIAWWLDLTQKGGEGMVVKPYEFLAYGKEGLLQPAVKCRGREYLRIIYAPEYDLPENLAQLKKRGLSKKRSLALREFALGVESLERFVNREPLRKIHEPVFGVLALESEEVDPRL
ncbi:MAG: polynucleotide kinase-phosphatase [Cyanobacteria bacterium P01_F01_bin.143]